MDIECKLVVEKGGEKVIDEDTKASTIVVVTAGSIKSIVIGDKEYPVRPYGDVAMKFRIVP